MNNHDRLWLWVLLSMLVLPWWAAGGVIGTLLVHDGHKRRKDQKAFDKLVADIIKDAAQGKAPKPRLHLVQGGSK